MEFVREKIHDVTQTLSDHHPTLARIAMSPFIPPGHKKSTYMKLNVDELKVDNTHSNFEEVWKE